MKRVVSFLLVLVFCFSLACPAFADFTGSPEGKPPTPTKPSTSKHWWSSSSNGNYKTGDIIMFWVLVLVVSVAALGVLYVIYRKKFC